MKINITLALSIISLGILFFSGCSESSRVEPSLHTDNEAKYILKLEATVPLDVRVRNSISHKIIFQGHLEKGDVQVIKQDEPFGRMEISGTDIEALVVRLYGKIIEQQTTIIEQPIASGIAKIFSD